MFKAEELGGRNRNCWYSTSESEGRKWDLVFLTSIFTLKYYSLDISATKFWQKSFEALRRVGGRQFQINVLAPSALGSVFSLRCLSGDWAYFDTLFLWLCNLVLRGRDSFGQRRGWPKGSRPLGTRLVAVPPKLSPMRTKTIPPGELRW